MTGLLMGWEYLACVVMYVHGNQGSESAIIVDCNKPSSLSMGVTMPGKEWLPVLAALHCLILEPPTGYMYPSVLSRQKYQSLLMADQSPLRVAQTMAKWSGTSHDWPNRSYRAKLLNGMGRLGHRSNCDERGGLPTPPSSVVHSPPHYISAECS
ncbi:hypothetical protein BJ085DRAFT_32501 [Dimargaris cristalligena]|uniref:Uncharacterized protein n=1 Tax=Dimargaris cristalligena TaxID=215637 RepID=A0A4Q0A007_9FUNG|nr:hypothetical protein BJ085DRAFT_32501 [Dimargaris cristalligena]|eukprot:RKP39317.1 hypothetical protein BJ085DRAFT_32501 [Dimargaris cristalligena]